jgi:hypothetical protein
MPSGWPLAKSYSRHAGFTKRSAERSGAQKLERPPDVMGGQRQAEVVVGGDGLEPPAFSV